MPLRRRSRIVASRPLDDVAGDDRRRSDGVQRSLRAAMASGDLTVVGRPMADVASGSVAGLEAAFRCGGPPGRFPAGDSEPVDARSVLAMVDDELALELSEMLVTGLGAVFEDRPRGPGLDLPAEPIVAVSVDRRFIAGDGFLPAIKAAVRASGLEARQLLLTVDGKPGLEPHWTDLQRLRSHGVEIAIDGFRLGSASIELLRRYPFDFVRFHLGLLGLGGGGGGALHDLVKLARNMDCRLLADGVTDAGQVDQLRAESCDLGVGPYYDRAGSG